MSYCRKDMDKVKAEYLAGGISLRNLADKWGIAHSSLFRIASKAGWSKERERCEREANAKVVERAVESRAENAIILDDSIAVFCAKLNERLRQPDSLITASDFRAIASTLKDMREVCTGAASDNSITVRFEGAEIDDFTE